MTLALVLKILGAVVVAGAHRTLIRAAREESTGWWVATFIVPGAAIAFGLRHFREFANTLLAILLGGIITASGYGVGLYQAVQETRAMAEQSGEFSEEDEEDEDDDGVDYAATPVFAASAVPADLRERAEQIQKRHSEITAARAKLDVRNQDAVRAFNLRAAEYHETLDRLRADFAAHQHTASSTR